METNQYFPAHPPSQSIINFFSNTAEEILTTGSRIISEVERQQRQEAPSPAPAPVVVAEPLSSENDNRNLWNENNELKQKVIELEKKVELLMEWTNRVANTVQMATNAPGLSPPSGLRPTEINEIPTIDEVD